MSLRLNLSYAMRNLPGQKVWQSRIREVDQKRNWAGEVRSEPLKETSARIKPGGMEKIPKLVGDIPWSGPKIK